MNFLEFVGGITLYAIALIAAGLLWWLFVQPAIQAISVTRWISACLKLANDGRECTFDEKWEHFKRYYEVGAPRILGLHNNYGSWYGIGRWTAELPRF